MCRLHLYTCFQEDEVRPLAPSKRTLDEDSRPPLCAGRKLGDVEKALLGTLLHEDPACPSRVLLDKVAQSRAPIPVSVRHLNRLRAIWKRNRRQGRPRQAPCHLPVASGAAVVQVRPGYRVLACISLPIGLSNRMPVAQLGSGSSRQSRPISTRILTMTVGCGITRADPAASLSGPVLCAPVWDRQAHRVRHPLREGGRS